MGFLLRTALVAVLAILLPALRPLGAQPPVRSFARFVSLAPHPGQQSAFEAGYRRHLDWHRGQRDPWVWRGWYVVMGERLGQFVDGTFGLAAARLDSAVAPAADAADNAANVTPYATFLTHALLEYLAAWSRGPADPGDAPLMELVTVDLLPGADAAFERALAAWAGQAVEPVFHWYRVAAGGPVGRYLLFRPRRGLTELALGRPVPWVDEGGRPLAGSVRSELLAYRPDLSYVPGGH